MIKKESSSNKFFLFPITPAYWKTAASECESLWTLTISAMFIALIVVISAFFVPVGENLRIYFSFFVKALGGVIYGPIVGLVVGFASDIIGTIVAPSGPFFFGYTLSAMVSGVLYGLFFYRTRITILRILLCKLVINVVVNILLGSIWSAMLMGKAYLYYVAKSIVKNALLLPVEVILLLLFFQLMLPILARLKIVPPQPTTRIPFIGIKKKE